MRRRAGTLIQTLAALFALAGLGLLWQLRPGLPVAPASWTAPMSGLQAQEIIFWIAYLLLAGLLLLTARTVLDALALRIRERREKRLHAFTERILSKPTPPAPPRRSRSPIYADRYTMTLAPRPNPDQPATTKTLAAPAVADANAADAVGLAAAETPPPELSISLLGPLRIEGLTQPLKRTATRELIAYLALHPAGARRDELLEALWPGQDPERVLPRFYQSVTDAHKALGPAWARDGERYQLDRTKIDVDLDQLDWHLAATGVAGEQQALEAALMLWRGQPLAGSDYPWAEPDIHRLHATLLDLLGRVGEARLVASDPRGALAAAEQAIALDELHEPTWRLALKADHALGLRSSLTKRYDALTHILDEQLGLQPSQETRHLYRQLLGQT